MDSLLHLAGKAKAIGRPMITYPLLLVAVTVIVTYSIAYPSFLQFKERSTENPPWSAFVDFTSRDRDAVDNLAVELSEAFGQAMIVDSCKSEALITTSASAMTNASEASLELVPASLLNRQDRIVYPLDVYVPESFVLEGDPHSGDGLLVDALTAQKLGVSVGDRLYVGLLFPRGDSRAQNVYIPKSAASSAGELVENIVFLEKTVCSIVAPSTHFEGVALFQPEESVRAYEQDGEASCTQLYILGVTQEKTQSIWASLRNQEHMDGVYLQTASEEVQWAKDIYAQDLGGLGAFHVTLTAGLLIVFFLLVIDGLRRLQNQMRSNAVLLSLGMSRRRLIRAFGLSSLILYGAIVALGCAAGFVFAGIAYPVWVTPEIKLKAVALTAGVLLVTVALLCAVLMARLKRMDIQKLLSEEG